MRTLAWLVLVAGCSVPESEIGSSEAAAGGGGCGATACPGPSWQSLGGSIVGAPDACSWGPGRLDVFARVTDGTLGHRYYNEDSGWSAWENLGGAIDSDPTCTSRGVGKLDVFARGSDSRHSMMQISYDRSLRWFQWSLWTGVVGPLGRGPDAGSYQHGTSSPLDTVWLDSGYHLWTSRFDGVSWASTWLQFVSSAADPAISSGAGGLDIWLRGTDGKLWHDANPFAVMGYWGGVHSHGIALASGPDAAAFPDSSGTVHVAFVNAMQRAQVAEMKSGTDTLGTPRDLGGPLTSDASIVVYRRASDEQCLFDYLFARGGDNAVWVTSAPASTLPCHPAAWPMTGQNAQRTYRSGLAGPQVAAAPSVVATGSLLAIGGDDRLIVQNGASVSALTTAGQTLWTLPLQASTPAEAAVGANGITYLKARYQDPAHCSGVVAVAPDGSVKWARDDWRCVQSIAVGPDNTVYFSAFSPWYSYDLTYYDAWIVALRPDDGGYLWSFSIGSPVYEIAVGADGRVVANLGPSLTSAFGEHSGVLAVANGQQVWYRSFPDEDVYFDHYGSPAVAADGSVYIPASVFDPIYDPYQSRWARIYAFDNLGTQRWEQTFSAGDGIPGLSLSASGTVYLDINEMGPADYPEIPRLAALEPGGGNLLWNTPHDGIDFNGTATVSGDGTLYIADRLGNLRAYSASGALLWQQPLGSNGTAPMIGRDGHLYLSVSSGSVLKL